MKQVYYSNPCDSSQTRDVDWRKRMSKCSISSRNTMAFSAQIPRTGGAQAKFKIAVTDLNVPWQHYQVAVHDRMITCIEWNSQGNHLMVCDEWGSMLIFKMEGHVLNNWTLIHKKHFVGESLLRGVWFHDGKKIDARVNVQDTYLKKYRRAMFSPSLKPPLNGYADGCLAISEFGAACAMVLPKNAGEMPLVIVQRLFAIPRRLRSVDICYGTTGDFLVAAHIAPTSFVNFFRITVSTNHDAPEPASAELDSQELRNRVEDAAADQVGSKRTAEEADSVGTTESAKKAPGAKKNTSVTNMKTQMTNGRKERGGKYTELKIFPEPLASLHLAPLEEDTSRRVTHLRFLYRENPERSTNASISLGETPHGVIVCMRDATKSTLELWLLREEAPPDTQPDQGASKTRTLKWQRLAVRECQAIVIAMATPKRYIFDNKPIPTQVVVAFNDYTIQRLQGSDLDGEPLLQICPGPPPEDVLPHDGLDICFSKSGSILMVVDAFNSQISMFRVGVPRGLPSVVSEKVPFLVSLFEYCIMASEDWLDVVLASDSESLAAVTAELLKNYDKQPARVKTHCYDRLLAVVGNLYRFINPKKEGEYFAKIVLRDVCATIGRYPKNRSGVKTLTDLMRNQEHVIYDIEEAMHKLERFDFKVCPGRLRLLRNHIQWITDLALNIALPFWIPSFSEHTQWVQGLIAEKGLIHHIRDALVMIRIWERNEGRQLTTYPDSVFDFDTVAIAFHLLTSALMHGKLSPPVGFHEAWAVLELRLSTSMMEFHGSSIGGVCCNEMYSRCVPIALEFDKPPDFLEESRIPYSTIDCYIADLPNSQAWWWASPKRIDRVRRCTRCFRSFSLRYSGHWRGPKFWEIRWAQLCPCGGRWALAPTSKLVDVDCENVLLLKKQ